MRAGPFLLLGIAAASAALGACAKSHAPAAPPPPLTEAYSLMDHGDNAKAIVLLEKQVQADPSSDEARALLASAYVGEAGVDVYRIHDTFYDVLFSRPLQKSFFTGASTAAPVADVSAPAPGPSASPSPVPGPAPVQQLIRLTDIFMAETQSIVGFLNRFPDVEKAKWPLLDRALEQLDTIVPESPDPASAKRHKDVMLYRVFIRVVYLKAYLAQELIGDRDFGNKRWACNVDLEALRESAEWVSHQLVLAADDFRAVFPDKGSSLDTLNAAASALDQELTRPVGSDGPAGTRTGLLELQSWLRSQSGC